jgi:hypothetical protein
MPRKKQPKSINIVDRRRRALELRRSGATYEQVARSIAQEFSLPKYNRSRAFEDIDFALAELNREFTLDTEGLRRLELEKLDQLELGIWKSAIGGNSQSIKAFVLLMDRRAKLCGLDGPVKLLIEQGLDKELTTLLDILEAGLPIETYKQVLALIATFHAGNKP